MFMIGFLLGDQCLVRGKKIAMVACLPLAELVIADVVPRVVALVREGLKAHLALWVDLFPHLLHER